MRGHASRRRWLAAVPGARSLHRQLFLWLLLPQVVLWAAAALFTLNLAGRYANEAVDASLAQASRALARQIKPTATGLFVDLPRSAQEILEADPTDRVLYSVSSPPDQFILGDPYLAPARIDRPVLGENYFYDTLYPAATAPGQAAAAPEPVRVVAVYLRFGTEGTTGGTMLVQVARSRASREELARRILLDIALPLSAVAAVLTALVWAGVRAGLRPLEHLQRQIEGRAANAIAPIELRAAPPEVHALAKAINTLIEREREHVAAQKRFISDAAHQLRTPLAGLKGQLDLALADARDAPQAARLQRVNEGAQRAARLVGQLLTLARAEPEASAAHNRTVVNLGVLAAEVCAQAVPRALAVGIDLGFDDRESPAAEPVHILGIPTLLREAIGNVVDNAIRYAGTGARVTVHVGTEGTRAIVDVEDDGPGIPAADCERMFGRFVRGTDTGDGCGLGLAIVREIVERHAGHVELRAAEPRGTLVRIELPRVSG